MNRMRIYKESDEKWGKSEVEWGVYEVKYIKLRWKWSESEEELSYIWGKIRWNEVKVSE